MNGDKTEIMIGTPARLSKINVSHVNICGEEISLSSRVRNLGIVLDNNLSMCQAVSNVRKVCFFELRKISHIRSLIDEEAAIKLVLSFVMSRLDYCNSLLKGITKENLNKLKKVQNHGA